MKEDKFDIEGMTCAACQAHVDKAVRKIDGVNNVEVNLLTNSMVVSYSDNITPDIINDAVEKAGYKSYLHDKKDNEEIKDNETKKLLKRLIISIIFLIPLFYLGMGYMAGWWSVGNLMDYPLIFGITTMLLALILMIINKAFFISGFKSVIHKSPNMDTLVALGSGVAFIYSLVIFYMMCYYTTIGNNDMAMELSMNLSFETAGMVPTLITIGKVLESYSKGKTTSALKDLIDLTPKVAHILEDDKEIIKNVSEVNLNEIYIVKPGENIPLDGVIIDGYASIDEQALTGESFPVEKNTGDKIYAGTINKNGTIKAKVEKISSESTISSIIKLVEDASRTKPKIARLADRVAGIFVPVVISIAIIVFTFWLIFGKNFVASNLANQTLLSYAIERAIAVLVISCPCALGLATPVAIMVSTGKGAKMGILFKNATVVEEAGKINFVVLDKTGTITKGKIEVVDIYSKNIDEKEFIKYAKSIEKNSNHPIAEAINKLDGDTYKIDNFIELPGFGLKATIDNKEIKALNYKRALEEVKFDQIDLNMIDKYQNDAKTIVVFIYDNKLIGIISLKDEIKEDSKVAIDGFKKLGITPIMLSGDNYGVTKSIAEACDIDYYISEALPSDKQNVINKLKEKGKVAMIGDGINDAIALKEADIGIAIGRGSDIAKDSSDIILVKSSLNDALSAIKLSKYTMLNIKENLFWAFFYNLIMIPIAAGAFSGVGLYKLKPWYGALAMSLSSFTVVMNALRINIFTPNKHLKKKNEIDIKDIIDNVKIKKEENEMELTLRVEGMMCEHCVKHVEDACKKVSGVTNAKASLKDKNVVVKYEKEVSKEELINSIKDAGYEAN